MEDWKNDRAEAEMRKSGEEMMKKAAKEKRKLVKSVKIEAKVRDCFHINLLNGNDEVVLSDNGYIPSWLPFNDYGNLNMVIDNETGKIVNWKPLNLVDIDKHNKETE